MSILCYHTVDDRWQSPLAVPSETFERHCRWLAAHRVVEDLPTAMARMDSAGRLPRRLVSLTFDDGLLGVYVHALPVLRRLGLPATLFAVSETLNDPPHPVDWVDTAPSWPLETLTDEQLLELEDSGVRIESHSATHADLTTLDEEECVRDLRDSRERLSDLLHRPVTLLAYPRGRHDAKVRKAAERAGYAAAFALPEQREEVGPFSLPRVGVYPQNGTAALRLKTTPGYLEMRTSPAFPSIPKTVRRSRNRAPAAV